MYDFNYYYSDNHDSSSFSIAYNESKTFFENFYELFKICPQPALMQNLTNIDSPFASYGSHMKNAYYCFGGMGTENTAYSMWAMKTRDSQDVLISLDCEKVYEAIFPEKSFNSNYVYFSKNILDSNLMYDCRNCSNCFGCVNLRNKSYCIENIQYTKEEYQEEIKKYNLEDKEVLLKSLETFWNLVRELPVRGSGNEHTVDSDGIFLLHTNNVTSSVWSINGEHSRFIEFTMNIKDSYDVVIGANSNTLCNTVVCGEESFKIKNSLFCRSSNDIEYSMNLRNCKYCFGCIGLRNKEYYIFNRPYSHDDYFIEVEKLKLIMNKEGVYGDFFPLYVSPYAYNASLAGLSGNIDEEKIKKEGGRFIDIKTNSNLKTISVKDLNNSLDLITTNFNQHALIGHGTQRPYRIRQEDLDFYRRHHVYLPLHHPYDRFKQRLAIVNNFEIVEANCVLCNQKLLTMHNNHQLIYCDSCFSKEVV